MVPALAAPALVLGLAAPARILAQPVQPGGPPSQGSGMQAGGLAPPPPMAEDPASARTEARLESADQEDSGRGLEWFWIDAEVGIEHVGLQTFGSDHLLDAGFHDTTRTGPVFGGALGLRLFFLTFGPRFRIATLGAYQLWTLDAEVGLRLPLGSLEPHFVLGGGYAALGSFGNGALTGVSGKDLDVSGYDLRLGGGLDYYVTDVFSVGASITGELLGLGRPAVSAGKLGAATAPAYASDGSSVGFGLTAAAVLGLHF